MYSHLIKGFTLGQTLTRRLGRTIAGFPGFLIDALLVAPLYAAQSGAYSGFWDEADGIPYADGILQRGFFQPLLGWLGDLAGAAVGAIVGTILGAVFYLPDGLLRVLAWAHDQVHNGFDVLATLIGNHRGFNDFNTYQPPQTYLQKAWNVSVGTVGLVLAAPLYALAKTAEFFLPFLGEGLSNLAWTTGGLLGGVIGGLASLCLWPVKHVCNKAVDLFRGFREGVRSFSAFVYSKTAQVPSVQGERRQDDCDCIPNPARHSQEFRDKVTTYNGMTTTQILFGALNVQRQPEPAQRVIQNPNAAPVNVQLVQQQNVQHPPGGPQGYLDQLEGIPNVYPNAPPLSPQRQI